MSNLDLVASFLDSEIPAENARFAVIYEQDPGAELINLLANRCNGGCLFGQALKDVPEGVSHRAPGDGRLPLPFLEDVSLIVVDKVSANLLEEVLFAAQPFARILVLGPTRGELPHLDCYSTIHYKNLELKFAQPVATELKGT